jgi:hypothetical protein
MTTIQARRAAPLTVLAAALAGCALAGCTAVGGTSGAPTTTTVGLREQAAPVYRELAACIRTHGYPAFPDPVVNDDGSADIPDDAQQELNRREAQIRPACEHIMRRLPAAVQKDEGGGEQVVTPAQVAERRRFAECVRRHGAPEFPDPDANGRFTITTTPDGRRGIDVQTARAFDACGGKGKDLKKDLGL